VTSSGPVLSSILRGDDAVDLFDAVRILGHQPGFMRIERPATASCNRPEEETR
jgi:hypothetical protein